MGEIIEGTRRHYVGDDADKDSIPAGGKAFGDSYHANDKGKQYYWNGTAWKTGLGYEYVPRAVAAIDFELAYLHNPGAGRNLDGTWQVDKLDISGIVPVGAVAAHIVINMLDNAANSFFHIRGNATDKVKNHIKLNTQVANIELPYMHGVIMLDSDRLLDYAGTAGLTAIGVTVLGWHI